MNSGSNIFDKVRQKVEIFSSKSRTRYFSAEQKRKQFLASSFPLIYFRVRAIKFWRLAVDYFVIVDIFRRRAVSTMRRATLAIGRAVSAIWRAEAATRRAEPANRRAIPAIGRADLTIRRATPANQFIGVNAWYYPFSSKNELNKRSANMAHKFLLAVVFSVFLPMSFLHAQAPISLFKGNR